MHISGSRVLHWSDPIHTMVSLNRLKPVAVLSEGAFVRTFRPATCNVFQPDVGP